MRSWLGTVGIRAALLGLMIVACKAEEEPVPPMHPAEPARRAAASFVHCVETGSSTCVRGSNKIGPWDAFKLLGWLGSGSPNAILAALPRELQNHGDADSVERRFVDDVERYHGVVRGAECDLAGEQSLPPLVDKVSAVAQERLENFGLWNADVERVVLGLADEARQGMQDAWLLRMKCRGDPYTLYLAAAPDQGRQVVVGMSTTLPAFLGGGDGDQSVVAARLRGKALGLSNVAAAVREGTVDSLWVPLPVEDF